MQSATAGSPRPESDRSAMKHIDLNPADYKILVVDDIATTGQSFIQMKRKCMQLGANSVVGVFLGKTV